MTNRFAHLFTDTVPNDAGPDYLATKDLIFPSVEGHRDGLDVQALIEPSRGLLLHIGPACMDRDGAAALVAHLSEILSATGTAAEAEYRRLALDFTTSTEDFLVADGAYQAALEPTHRADTEPTIEGDLEDVPSDRVSSAD